MFRNGLKILWRPIKDGQDITNQLMIVLSSAVILSAIVVVIALLISYNPDKTYYTTREKLGREYIRFTKLQHKLDLDEKTKIYGWPDNAYYFDSNGRRRPFGKSYKEVE